MKRKWNTSSHVPKTYTCDTNNHVLDSKGQAAPRAPVFGLFPWVIAILFLPSRHCCLLVLAKAGEALNVCGTPTSPEFEFAFFVPIFCAILQCIEEKEGGGLLGIYLDGRSCVSKGKNSCSKPNILQQLQLGSTLATLCGGSPNSLMQRSSISSLVSKKHIKK